MITSRSGVRALGPTDLTSLLRLTALDPVTNVFAEHRARSTSLEPRLLFGDFWGEFDAGGELYAACHAGTNLVPIQCSPEAAERFAYKVRYRRRGISTLVGPRSQVAPMYAVLQHAWGRARDERWHQPHLETNRLSPVRPPHGVRRATAADLDRLYPACVAMYTEEVGHSPEVGGNAVAYRARISQLVSRGWSFVWCENDEVIFKAEVANLTPSAAQVQGVWTAPSLRGQGIAKAGMAAVVDLVLSELAPVVSLYVNAWNHPAQAVYRRVGFTQTNEFATVMW